MRGAFEGISRLTTKSTKEIFQFLLRFLCPFVATVLKFEAARNLYYTIQSTAADRVRLSDLTEGWAVEDRVAGSA